jgi:hypothetical protein
MAKPEFRDGAEDAPSLYFLREIGSSSPENAIGFGRTKIKTMRIRSVERFKPA